MHHINLFTVIGFIVIVGIGYFIYRGWQKSRAPK